MGTLALLKEVIEANQGTFIEGDDRRMRASVSPLLDSGITGQSFLLEVVWSDGLLTAREAEPDRLPCFCPERHINGGGIFCLYWDEEEPLTFVCQEDLELWWGKVLLFLRRQIAAARLRRWPGKGAARAHGRLAAKHQREAEVAATSLGPKFGKGLREERFATSKARVGGHKRLRLFLDGAKIATVDLSTKRVMSLRSRCRCEDAERHRRPLIACGDHADALASLAVSVHGRAIARVPGTEAAFEERERENLVAKRAIADAAFEMIRPGSAVFLDAGTTVLQLARRIRLEPMPLSIFTNGLTVAEALMGARDLKVSLIGGRIRTENASTVGPAAMDALARLGIDQLFLGTGAVAEDGCLYSLDEDEAHLNARMIERATETMLLADASKFGRRLIHRVAGLGPAIRLITDASLTPHWRGRLADLSCQVLAVEPSLSLVRPDPPSFPMKGSPHEPQVHHRRAFGAAPPLHRARVR